MDLCIKMAQPRYCRSMRPTCKGVPYLVAGDFSRRLSPTAYHGAGYRGSSAGDSFPDDIYSCFDPNDELALREINGILFRGQWLSVFTTNDQIDGPPSVVTGKARVEHVIPDGVQHVVDAQIGLSLLCLYRGRR